MSWIKTALSVTTSESNSFYSVTDPALFYEWRFNEIVPKGTKFTKLLPATTVCADEKIILSVRIPESVLEKNENIYTLKTDLDARPNIVAGQIASPLEVYKKFEDLKKKFASDFDNFKKSILNQRFITTPDKQPKLYEVIGSNNDFAEVRSFGLLKDIKDKLNKVHYALKQGANQRVWRSYERETLNRFENYLSMLDNPQVPMDAVKMSYVLKTAKVNMDDVFRLRWNELYYMLYRDAKDCMEKIEHFDSLGWVKYTQNYLKKQN